MSRSGEDGYILASATISMIILGALATGILMIAVGELRRVRAEEERVQMMLLYESVAVLTAAELTKEPDARTLRFDDARQTLSIEGVSFDVSLEWESEKLDLNYAELDMIETQAQDLLSHTSHVQALMSQVETARESGTPIRLIGDLSFEDARVTECLRLVSLCSAVAADSAKGLIARACLTGRRRVRGSGSWLWSRGRIRWRTWFC